MLEKIVDLTKVSIDFPELKEPQILRDPMIDTLEDMLESLDLVIVEGKEGMGKTTLLAQFAKRHKSCTISIFINSTSRYTYDPANIQFEFCNQINWILYKDILYNLTKILVSHFVNIILNIWRIYGENNHRSIVIRTTYPGL
jgi:translation initiation factor RLI1